MTYNMRSYLAFSSYDLYLVDKCSQVTKSQSCAMRACEKPYEYNTTILVLLAYVSYAITTVVYLVPNYVVCLHCYQEYERPTVNLYVMKSTEVPTLGAMELHNEVAIGPAEFLFPVKLG